MKRIFGVLAVTVAMVVLAAACTGPTGPSLEKVQAWAKTQPSADAASDSNVLASTVSRDGGETSFGAGPGASQNVTGLTVRCYGAPKLTITVTLITSTSTQVVRAPGIRCDRKSHTVAIDASGVTNATIAAKRTGSPTAWIGTLLGGQSPARADIAAWVNENQRNVADTPPHTVIAGLLDTQPGNADAGATLSKSFTPAATVTAVHVACYGAPTMRVRLSVAGPTRDNATPVSVHTTDPVPCDRLTHIEKLSVHDAATITVSGADVTSDTSFLVYVTGTQR